MLRASKTLFEPHLLLDVLNSKVLSEFLGYRFDSLSWGYYSYTSAMSGREDFLSQPAPENYVAGLGRGVTGFTTRSDLGPAKEGPSEDRIKEALTKRAAQLGATPPIAYGATEEKAEEVDEGDDERFQDPENETGLFSGGDFMAEDDVADRIYRDVDERMEKRRKSRRFVALVSCTLSIFKAGHMIY